MTLQLLCCQFTTSPQLLLVTTSPWAWLYSSSGNSKIPLKSSLLLWWLCSSPVVIWHLLPCLSSSSIVSATLRICCYSYDCKSSGSSAIDHDCSSGDSAASLEWPYILWAVQLLLWLDDYTKESAAPLTYTQVLRWLCSTFVVIPLIPCCDSTTHPMTSQLIQSHHSSTGYSEAPQVTLQLFFMDSKSFTLETLQLLSWDSPSPL